MKKLLLCINHKKTEQAIITELQDSFICVGELTYKEAIQPYLKNNTVDVLVIRDSLQGSIPILDLIEEIRERSPQTRIVFISKERPKKDIFLATLVALGIYDIINKDVVPVDEIISYIHHPRNFADVSMYYTGPHRKEVEDEPETEEEPQSNKFGGLLTSIFGSGKSSSHHNASQSSDSSNSGEKIDIDNLRSVIRREEANKANANKELEINAAVEKATKDQRDEIDELKQSITSLKTDVRRFSEQSEESKIQENEAKLKSDIATKRAKELEAEIAKMRTEHSKQIASLTSMDDNSSVFKAEIEAKEQELSKAQLKIDELEIHLKEVQDQIQLQKESPDEEHSIEIQALQQQLDEARKKIHDLESRPVETVGPAEDYSEGEDAEVSYNEEFIEPTNGQAHSIVFMGSKHGIGNSTIALNTAVSLSKHGYKVLFMEFNSRYPMINHFFELVNITSGIDTACDGILSNNTGAVDKAIIQPHHLRPQKRALVRSYKKLPAGLHFMLYSNGYLASGQHELDQRGMKDLFFYLTMKLQYAYIIIDIQPDDDMAVDLFLRSGFLTDKLIMTMSQDTHSLISAMGKIHELASGRSVNLIQNAVMVLNRYRNEASIKKADILKWMQNANIQVSAKSMVCMSDDPVVYYDSSSFGVPYACSKGKFVGEYESIVNLIV